MAPANLQQINFSKTQRLVLLIDLHPILTLQNPFPYLDAITAVAKRLLRFPPLSETLSAFKFFFSSLSPIRSTAVLPRHLYTRCLSFSLPTQTLANLSTTLNSISILTDLPNVPCSVRASYAASSLLQLIHDYAWETEKDNVLGEDTLVGSDFIKIPSNLVILLSPIGKSVNCLAEYLEMSEFDEAFRVVREAFVVRDIHLCWVDVKSDASEIEGANEKRSECGVKLETLEECIRKMRWGFCSSDLIVLGSALMPMGLIYPKIGMPFDFVDFGGLDKKKYSGELSLEISDVNGMPLECRCCNLEFVNLKRLPCTIDTSDFWNASESRDSQSLHCQDVFWVRLGKGNVKVHVKSVERYDGCEKIGGLSEIVLVREGFQESRKNRLKSDDVFFADTVIEMMHREMGGVTWKNQMPAWQMFLSFLHMKGYWALVSLSGSNGDTLMGSLKPFTAHLAIIHVMDACHISTRDKRGSNGKTSDTSVEDMNDSNSCCGSQTNASTSGNCERYGDGKRKKRLRHLYMEMTWSSFCKAAFEGSNFDLFDLYIARYLEKSKKLKFLKCWMRQIIKVDQCLLTTLLGSQSTEEISVCNDSSSKPSPAKETAKPVSKPETSETFFNNLSDRIQHGLESGMDLQNLAERVVKSSIHWLRHKCENVNNSEGQESIRNSDDSCNEAVEEKLIKLLLRAPKEMKKIHQDASSELVVREYEMQILLRLEIMGSDISAMIGESRKQKMLKQICALLEIIQYLVAGGIHGHVSLYDYVERTIRAREAHAEEKSDRSSKSGNGILSDEMDSRLKDLYEKYKDNPHCCRLIAGELDPSPAKEAAKPVSKPETSGTFFNNLSDRIQHGLESGMDLQNLAERVVKSSIHWLRHKFENVNNSEGQESMRNSDDSCNEAVGEKLIELLLRAPKEMKKIHQDSSSELIVREYEMQILLRLEILRSDISAMMGESRKQKMLKQICSLLETIQYLVAGGIHGHVSLYDYVERTIRARYSDELEDIVKAIYTRMDLLPFGDDDEAPNLLFNSEDSNQSWRDKHDRKENNSVSTEGESSQPLASTFEEIEKDEHTQNLNEARERRERARRFAPFLGKARDLQRVWAPKNPKLVKCKFDSLPRKSKRKDKQTPSNSVVYETPMTGNKRACFRENNKGDKENSVSKALFQDN